MKQIYIQIEINRCTTLHDYNKWSADNRRRAISHHTVSVYAASPNDNGASAAKYDLIWTCSYRDAVAAFLTITLD